MTKRPFRPMNSNPYWNRPARHMYNLELMLWRPQLWSDSPRVEVSRSHLLLSLQGKPCKTAGWRGLHEAHHSQHGITAHRHIQLYKKRVAPCFVVVLQRSSEGPGG